MRSMMWDGFKLPKSDHHSPIAPGFPLWGTSGLRFKNKLMMKVGDKEAIARSPATLE